MIPFHLHNGADKIGHTTPGPDSGSQLIAPGVIVIEDNPHAPGPTLSFGPGEVGRGAFIVQLNTSTLTFDDIVASQPGATFENVAGYDLLVVGGLAAFIDFPEGPVQVQSLAFSHENSGLELARLIAESRADHQAAGVCVSAEFGWKRVPTSFQQTWSLLRKGKHKHIREEGSAAASDAVVSGLGLQPDGFLLSWHSKGELLGPNARFGSTSNFGGVRRTNSFNQRQRT